MKPTLELFVASTLAMALCFGIAACSQTPAVYPPAGADHIADPYVKQLVALVGNHQPADPAPDSWGMDAKTGRFIAPTLTPDTHDAHPFDGELDYWDTEQYIHNMKIEAYYPITVEPFHTWQNMVDFDGRRYLYQYVRRDLKIFDITDPKDVQLLLTRGNTWGANGPDEEVNPYPEDDYFGAASIQWNEKLGVNVMIQSI